PTLSVFLFFYTIPRPPRSPLFPYTTLFRSSLAIPAAGIETSGGSYNSMLGSPRLTRAPESSGRTEGRAREAAGRHIVGGFMPSFILTERRDAVAIVTLNRTEVYNARHRPMRQGLGRQPPPLGP